LDRETVKIDALIEELRRLIELLKEKRQTVISHAVTKGLNPDAPMKDSGDGELGRIPQNWRVITLKHFSRLQRGHDLTSDQQEEGPYPVVTSGGISGSHSKYIAKAPGVVTGRYGSTGRLFYLEQDYWPHNTALYVSDFFENYPRFVWYSLQAINFESHSAKSAVPGIDRNDLHVLPVAVPPLHQQLDITAYLDKKMEEFDQLEAETQIAMTLLQERRSALISAAVTGKIDIRNYAPKETHGSA
jgi:type I restriction enzyme, S subunit